MLMVAHRKGGRIRWNRDDRLVPNIYSLMPDRVRLHPNEKPLRLMQSVVGTHSNEGDVVLDPFMGSGTTLAACATMGRAGIGIEIDEGYFDIACKRIRDAYAQPDFFVEQERPAPAKQEALDL